MPIYEYICNNCGSSKEKLQKISDPELTLCEQCNLHSLKKQISATSFRLKGNGWYETDFKTKHEKQRHLADYPNNNTTTKQSKVENNQQNKPATSNTKQPPANTEKTNTS